MSNLESDGATSSMELVNKIEYDNLVATVTRLRAAVEIATKTLKRICGDIPLDEEYSTHKEDMKSAAKALIEMAAVLTTV
jgi:hypothetical protein